MTKITWTKACACERDRDGNPATATSNRLISKSERRGDQILVTCTFYPELVCDVCDVPWQETARDTVPDTYADVSKQGNTTDQNPTPIP